MTRKQKIGELLVALIELTEPGLNAVDGAIAEQIAAGESRGLDGEIEETVAKLGAGVVNFVDDELRLVSPPDVGDVTQLALHEVLDAGGDLRVLLGEHTFECLFDQAIFVATATPERRADEARKLREGITDPAFDESVREAMRKGSRSSSAGLAEQKIQMRWSADLYDDPDLLPRVVEFATAKQRRALDNWIEHCRSRDLPLEDRLDLLEEQFRLNGEIIAELAERIRALDLD